MGISAQVSEERERREKRGKRERERVKSRYFTLVFADLCKVSLILWFKCTTTGNPDDLSKPTLELTCYPPVLLRVESDVQTM